jgi:ATP-dependent DNA ligase
MVLPVTPPVSPMLAKLARELPTGDEWSYEPKWDGFRCIVFRDGDDVQLGSRNERPLTRYFPEILDPLRAALPERAVVDGELVIATAGGLDFDLLSLRIHPAASRVAMLAEQTPSSFVAFDVLAAGDDDLRDRPFAERRARLERLVAESGPVHVTPATTDRGTAERWFDEFEGAGLDGVVAKPLDGPYREGERTMVKVKHQRTADCVVAGFRWHKKGDGMVGSLLLGLFDDEGALQHVGVCSSFSVEKRHELAEFLEAYRKNALESHPWRSWAEHDPEAGMKRMPGGQSRWSQGKDLSWEPVRPELVAEVAYDHMQGDRFRHIAQFRHWRVDKKPADCTYAQLEVVAPQELAAIFPEGR